jgi:hypothetical protein
VPFTQLYVPFTQLYVPFTQLYVPFTQLYVPFTQLYVPFTQLYVPFDILLTRGRHFHDRIISLLEMALANATNLTLQLFLKCIYQSRKVC